MLVEFRVSNFRSFNEEQTFSLVPGLDRKHGDNLIDAGGLKLLKCASVYGANASGKSNLVKALNVMEHFICVSATQMNQGDKIPGVAPFRLSSATAGQPSRFVTIVALGGTLYEYGFSATAERVLEEWLAAGPARGKKRLWFKRSWDHSKDAEWFFDEPLIEEQAVLRERTRDNGLVLSRGAEQNVKPLSDLFLWFFRRLWVLDLSQDPSGLVNATARRIRKSGKFEQRVVGLLKDADVGIEGIQIEDGPPPEPEVIEFIRKQLPKTDSAKLDQEFFSSPSIQTLHRVRDTGALVRFGMEEDESKGSQRFFALAGPLVDALEKGAVVVVDELDCSMHPLLTRKLIELFQSPTANTKGAQLVFTTHDSTLMIPSLFRRDQIWLVEKNAAGASQLRSLYDFRKPRSSEAFQKNYLAGRYGAVPNFGPTFEDLEIP
jgi:hypothetical protein